MSYRELVEGKRPPVVIDPAMVAQLLAALQCGDTVKDVVKAWGFCSVDELVLSFAYGWMCNHVDGDCDCNGRIRVRV